MFPASHIARARIANVAVLLAGTAFAALSPDFDCDASYKTLSRDLVAMHGSDPQRLAVLNRKALRFYDACRMGDLDDAAALFSRLQNEALGGL